MIWSGSIPTSKKKEPPISQEGAKQDWAKWNMPIASENADFPDPFFHMVQQDTTNRKLKSIDAFSSLGSPQ